MTYKVLFDSTGSAAGWLLFSAPPMFLALFVVGVVVFLDWGTWRNDWKALLRETGLLLLIAIGVMSRLSFSYNRYFHYWYDKGPFATVEGPVEKYRASMVGTSSYERFEVGNAGFSYTSSQMIKCFHKTVANGGPIHDGLLVRITYHDNCIVKLETVGD